jgi:hypothetical protein
VDQLITIETAPTPRRKMAPIVVYPRFAQARHAASRRINVTVRSRRRSIPASVADRESCGCTTMAPMHGLEPSVPG